MVAYFGYGTNRDHDMMAAMIGRDHIWGVKATLPGYELAIQSLERIPDKILPTAPVPRSPREIMKTALGEKAELYIIRPNPKGVTHGTVWQLTSEEYEMVRDWELLDFGMQEDLAGEARTESGDNIHVQTHGSKDPGLPVDRVVEGKDYEDYIVPRQAILETARRVHREFMERVSQVDSQKTSPEN